MHRSTSARFPSTCSPLYYSIPIQTILHFNCDHNIDVQHQTIADLSSCFRSTADDRRSLSDESRQCQRWCQLCHLFDFAGSCRQTNHRLQ